MLRPSSLQARLAAPLVALLQQHDQAVDPNLVSLAEAWQQVEEALRAQGKSPEEAAHLAATAAGAAIARTLTASGLLPDLLPVTCVLFSSLSNSARQDVAVCALHRRCCAVLTGPRPAG
jgi:hypothetical protein